MLTSGDSITAIVRAGIAVIARKRVSRLASGHTIAGLCAVTGIIIATHHRCSRDTCSIGTRIRVRARIVVTTSCRIRYRLAAGNRIAAIVRTPIPIVAGQRRTGTTNAGLTGGDPIADIAVITTCTVLRG